jgi:2-(1,2-epoxy-1,2-dihydrophenyl)acetyl-CoA isomerase
MNTTTENILCDITDGVATLTLNRPEKLNAITDPMRGELLAAVRSADTDPNVRVITITGAGKAFCAGGDIPYLKHLKETNNEKNFVRLLDEGRTLVQTLRDSHKPTIALVNGPAFGGGLIIAMACDIRVCSRTASFGVPFIKIGLGPDWGGTYLLTRIVRIAKALEMFCTGERLDAEEALRIGLVNHVWPLEELQRRGADFAAQLAAWPPEILARYKRAVYHAANHTFEDTADLERQYQLENFRSDQVIESIDAFLERRTPR